MERIQWIIYGPLGMTMEQASKLAPIELVNAWHGYIWRRQQAENTLASLVTVWIANSAGKSFKKRIKLEDIFSDGRFRKKFNDEDMKMIKELFG